MKVRRILAALASPFTVKRRNDSMIAQLIDEGKLHPDDVRVLLMACRAGLRLYRWPDGRLRLSRPFDEVAS